ncbi:MAG: NifB/NifX family molybdenum-iron cluster-binding protein [Candidatus Cloacimonetes bacterium]|nr:NifB/NifX family molybdenum-iron cluster-binding protein [Candidatus Cloacimonadota bacterium]
MRIAIPVTDGKLSAHFGHCEKFIIFDADEAGKKIIKEEVLIPPAHEPGLLPRWLAEQKANVIIAGGMGQRAQDLFTQNDIKVEVGAAAKSPRQLVENYLNNELETGSNLCDH